MTCAASGEEAEAILRPGRPPPFELVLTDLVMPGRSGMDVLRTALERNPSCTVLVLSGYGTLREATEAMDRGAYGLVNKPLQLESFRQTLRRIVERTHLIMERDALKAQVRGAGPAGGGHGDHPGPDGDAGPGDHPGDRAEPAATRICGICRPGRLHTRGQLTDGEFEAAKKSLLSKWLS